MYRIEIDEHAGMKIVSGRADFLNRRIQMVYESTLCIRVGETNIKSSDPNSEPQGITNYDFELPCKILDHSDQFGLGPHPPPFGKGNEGVFQLFLK